MRTLVVLAVMGVCSASYQAYNPGYGHYGYAQPKWVGPVAATVPAGVGGKIIPVSDTYEVAAARNNFFKLYQDQLATIRAHRYGTPSYGHPGAAFIPGVHAHYGGSAHYGAHAHSYGAHAHSYGAPAYGYHGVPTQVGDTPEVAAAKAEHFRLYNKQAAAAAAAPDYYAAPSHSYGAHAHSFGAHAHSYGPHAHSYGAPAYGYHGAPTQVGDTPEVAAAKAEHFRLYNKQAAAAAAAPDHYTYHYH